MLKGFFFSEVASRDFGSQPKLVEGKSHVLLAA